jgi:serine/threonine protein phosphatase PrpC
MNNSENEAKKTSQPKAEITQPKSLLDRARQVWHKWRPKLERPAEPEPITLPEALNVVIKTEIGTSYHGEVFGQTRRQTRQSRDQSNCQAIDGGKGVLVIECDGAGDSIYAARLARHVVNQVSAEASLFTTTTPISEQEEVFLTAPIKGAANFHFNSVDTSGLNPDKNVSTTLTGYVILNKELVGAHAGDSELHLLRKTRSRCLSARHHHDSDEGWLLRAVSRSDVQSEADFDGHSIRESLRSGDILLTFSDGFAKYFFDPMMIDIYSDEVEKVEDYNVFRRNADKRLGVFYQKRMQALYDLIMELVAKGQNPVEALLADAKRQAESEAAHPKNPEGYHDDITLNITIVD